MIFFGASLGGTTKNNTPQNFETDSTLGQNITHLKKAFHFKFYIKILSKSYRIWNFNWIHTNFNLIFQMNGQGKGFKKITFGVLLFKNTKWNFFSFIYIYLIYRGAWNNILKKINNMDWGNHKFINNFQRLGLRGFERPLCSCLQTWNNYNFLFQ